MRYIYLKVHIYYTYLLLNEGFGNNIFLSTLNVEWDICQISLFLIRILYKSYYAIIL